jgi:hypothetical protein
MSDTPEDIDAWKQRVREGLAESGYTVPFETDIVEPNRLVHGVHVATADYPHGPFLHWQHPENCQCPIERPGPGG